MDLDLIRKTLKDFTDGSETIVAAMVKGVPAAQALLVWLRSLPEDALREALTGEPATASIVTRGVETLGEFNLVMGDIARILSRHRRPRLDLN